jgi:hypothetical protein
MADISKKAAKKARKREKLLLSKQTAQPDIQLTTKSCPIAATSPPVVSNTATSATTIANGTVETVAELDAKLKQMEQKWAETSTSPLPEGIRNAVMDLRAALVLQEAAAQPVEAPIYQVQMSRNGEEREDEKDEKMKESAKRIAQEREKREKESVKEEKLEEVRTTANTTDGSVIRQSPKSFDWAEDVSATVTPTPVTLVAPAARAPRDFSALRSSNRNPWGSLSRRHRRSQPCTQNSFYSCHYNTNYPHKPPPLPPAPIQLVETIRHPHGIVPTKPIIKTSSAASTPILHSSISTQSREPLSAVRSDSSFRPSSAPSLDWNGDPLLAGLARILEALGWVRKTKRRGRRFVRGGHME